jgi:4a-hydroxytetrahydrobiopterin dehydratase
MARRDQLLGDDAIAEALRTLDGWSGDRRGIERRAEFSTFRVAIAVVDAVAEIAEEMDHHPDIDIRWRTLTFRNVTHSAGGVTGLDLELARRIDAVVADRIRL